MSFPRHRFDVQRKWVEYVSFCHPCQLSVQLLLLVIKEVQNEEKNEVVIKTLMMVKSKEERELVQLVM